MKRWTTVAIFAIAIIGVVFSMYQQGAGNKQPLRVYVPCGMTLPFKELGMTYERQHRRTKVETTFDNSNVLLKFVMDKGKMPDIFISPGKKEIAILEEKGFIEKGSVRPFGKYELILIAPSKSAAVKGISDLLNESVRTIALANPDFNSIGAYAKEALASLGYWDKLQGKLLLTNTPIETLSYVAASKAEAAIHYNICPFETSSDKVAQGAIRIVATLPSESHQPIHSFVGILKGAQNKAAAKGFVEFMYSRKGNAILNQYGLGEPEAEGAISAQAQGAGKVVIEAYYPFNEEHFCMKEYFESLRDKYKGRAKVECVDFREDKGYVRWRKSGLTCGGILINGKNKFTVADAEGAPKEVEFVKKMDVFWTKEDLEAAIEQELMREN